MLHLSYEKIKAKFDGEKIALEEYEYLGFAHGSTGLSGHLSSRIALKKYGYNDEFIDKEIKSAVKNIIDRGLNHNFCICHGDLGNLLELFESADILEDNVLREQW